VLLATSAIPGEDFDPHDALVPESIVIPMLLLFTMATMIARQSMVSSVFSMARRAICLNRFSRLEVVQTRAEQERQTYLPSIAGLRLVGRPVAVLLAPGSTRLTRTYGIALTLDSAITEALFPVVDRRSWRRRRRRVMLRLGILLLADVTLVPANMTNLASGG
jgi:KUP system potassium uptake protein